MSWAKSLQPRHRVPQSLAELRMLPRPMPTHLVEMVEDDPPFRLRKGDLLLVYPYVLDPGAKWSVDEALNGGVGGFNLYRSQVRVINPL